MDGIRVRTGRRRVLVVEDDADIARLIDVSLKRVMPDLEVVVTDNGRDAFRLATEPGFDLAVCDIMLPALDGSRLLKMLAQHPFAARLPIVILSGVDPDRLAVVKELPNVVAHWHKPVDLPLFARSVKRLLMEDGPAGTQRDRP